MPDKTGRNMVSVPADAMVKVLEVQRELTEQMGFAPSIAQVVRHLIELGLAAKTQHNVSDVLSAAR